MGRLLGGEHASTPQSGVGPRLLKRSLPRLYCCCFGSTESCQLIVQGTPQWQRTLRHRGFKKLAKNPSQPATATPTRFPGCELRRSERLRELTHAVTARYKLMEIIQKFSSANCAGSSVSTFTWKTQEVHPKVSVDCRNAQGQVAARYKELVEITYKKDANSAST